MNILKTLSPKRLKLVLIAAPLALGALYFGVFAADRYVSESTVAVRQAGSDASSLPGASLLLAAISPPSQQETLYVKQFVHSLGLLQQLDRKLGLRRHYEAARWDPLYRVWDWTSQENFLDYYRGRVDVHVDELSSALTLRVQGFDAAFAQQLNRAILDESERFVNEMSHKLAREKLGFAEEELARASKRLQQSKEAVLAFQNRHQVLDPTAAAQASGTVTAELQATITKTEAELRSLRAFLNDDAAQVKALQSQIDGMRAQMQQERTRATGNGAKSDRLGALAIEFRGLQLQADFAVDAYKVALGAVENARIDASRKLKSLVVIEPASLPQTAEYPRRTYNLLTLLVVCALLYAIARLVLAIVREHQD